MLQKTEDVKTWDTSGLLYAGRGLFDLVLMMPSRWSIYTRLKNVGQGFSSDVDWPMWSTRRLL